MARKLQNRKAASASRWSGEFQASLVRQTITIPPEMKIQIDALVGRGKFSVFAQKALTHELQQQSLPGWLDERTGARGGKPLNAESIEFAEKAWRKRKAR